MSNSTKKLSREQIAMRQAATALFVTIPAQVELAGANVTHMSLYNKGYEWTLLVKTETEQGKVEVGFATSVMPYDAINSFTGRLVNSGINWKPDKFAQKQPKQNKG